MTRDTSSLHVAFAIALRSAALLSTLLVGSGCDCDSNEQGYRIAPAGRNLSAPLAPRQAFDQELTRACGEIGPGPAASNLIRAPYLQSVSDTLATLVWTSTVPDLRVEHRLAGSDEPVTLSGQLDSSAELPKGAQYLAAMSELAPKTIYCYQLLSDDALLFQGGFRTAPTPDDSVRFSALGDLGTSSKDQLAVRDQLESVDSDFLLLTGDLAYESGTLAQYEAHVFTVYRDLFALVPLFPASGNHDYQTRDAEAFRQVFVLPTNGGHEGRERWYSFDWGPVHVAVLDTETKLDAQASWLRQDLAATELPWKVVALHKPPFSSGAHGSEQSVRDSLVPVFVEQEVDLVLAGHEHSYERSTAQDGVHYVVTGGGGRGTRPVGSSDFTAFSARVAHFVYIEASPSALTLHAIDASGQEFASLQLKR